MDDIQELASILGKDVEELYQHICARVMQDIDRQNFALFPMLCFLRDVYEKKPKIFPVLLDLLCDPDVSTRDLAEKHGISQSMVVKRLKQVGERWPEVDLSLLPRRQRVLPSGEGQKRGRAGKVTTKINSTAKNHAE